MIPERQAVRQHRRRRRTYIALAGFLCLTGAGDFAVDRPVAGVLAAILAMVALRYAHELRD